MFQCKQRSSSCNRLRKRNFYFLQALWMRHKLQFTSYNRLAVSLQMSRTWTVKRVHGEWEEEWIVNERMFWWPFHVNVIYTSYSLLKEQKWKKKKNYSLCHLKATSSCKGLLRSTVFLHVTQWMSPCCESIFNLNLATLNVKVSWSVFIKRWKLFDLHAKNININSFQLSGLSK